MALPIDHASLHFEPFVHLAGLEYDQALIGLRCIEAATPDGQPFELPIKPRHDDLTR